MEGSREEMPPREGEAGEGGREGGMEGGREGGWHGASNAFSCVVEVHEGKFKPSLRPQLLLTRSLAALTDGAGNRETLISSYLEIYSSPRHEPWCIASFQAAPFISPDICTTFHETRALTAPARLMPLCPSALKPYCFKYA